MGKSWETKAITVDNLFLTKPLTNIISYKMMRQKILQSISML